MAESNINVTPGSGGPNIDLELVDNGNARQVICIGDPSTGAKVAPVDATLGLSVNITNSTSPLPSGAATAANQTNAAQKTQIVDGSGNVIASTTNALNVQVAGAAGNLPANVTQYGSTNISTGTGASGAGIPRVTVSNDSNVLVTQSTSPWVDNLTQVGGVSVVAQAKQVQATNFFPVQEITNSGRTTINFSIDRIAGVTAEALATFTINKGGTVTSGTSYTVTTGKTLRIQSFHATILDSTTTSVDGRVRIRAAGTVSAASPIYGLIDVGTFTGTALAGAGLAIEIDYPDGLEIPSGTQVGISQIISSASSTVTVGIVAFEY